MNSWSHELDWDRETLLELCERDREDVTADFLFERPGFAKKHAAVWIEEFLDYNGVLVDDRPLPRGQLGLCDMKKGWIFLNSEMGRFVGPNTDLRALRVCTLAHELGHLRLHQDEDGGSVLVSFYGEARLHHPRSFQREMEADLYAGVFLLPLKALHGNKFISYLFEHRGMKFSLNNCYLWKALCEAAAMFGVSPSLMKNRLIGLGWIEQMGPRRPGTHARLRIVPSDEIMT